MSVFDFPTWAYAKLADKPAPEGVKPMPAPTLDEIEAMQTARHDVKAMQSHWPTEEERVEQSQSTLRPKTPYLPEPEPVKRKPGRPRKVSQDAG